MKAISAQLRSLIGLESTNLCRLWTITLLNGSVYRFTDLNTSILFDGNVYTPDPGITVSAIRAELNGPPSDASIEVAMNDDFLTKDMARRGSLDEAKININMVDYRNLGVGSVFMFNGEVSEVSVTDVGSCTLTVSGLSGRGDARLNERYSESCRNTYGDSLCGIDVASLNVPFTITDVASRNNWIETDDLDQINNHWLLGTVTFTTGDSIGQRYELNSSSLLATPTRNRLYFALKPRFQLAIGDEGIITPGCGKSIDIDCRQKNNNVANFRGEPFVPNFSFEVSTDIVSKISSSITGSIEETVLVSYERYVIN